MATDHELDDFDKNVLIKGKNKCLHSSKTTSFAWFLPKIAISPIFGLQWPFSNFQPQNRQLLARNDFPPSFVKDDNFPNSWVQKTIFVFHSRNSYWTAHFLLLLARNDHFTKSSEPKIAILFSACHGFLHKNNDFSSEGQDLVAELTRTESSTGRFVAPEGGSYLNMKRIQQIQIKEGLHNFVSELKKIAGFKKNPPPQPRPILIGVGSSSLDVGPCEKLQKYLLESGIFRNFEKSELSENRSSSNQSFWEIKESNFHRIFRVHAGQWLGSEIGLSSS